MAAERSVDAYIAALPGDQRAIAEAVRLVVRSAAPEAREAFKWSQPVFESAGPFAYIKAFPRHVNFGFWRGVELDRGRGILETSGSKMAHVKLRRLADLDEPVLADIVREAVRLNAEKGDPSRTR